VKATDAIVAWTPVELAARFQSPAWNRTAGSVALAVRGEDRRLKDYALILAPCGQDGPEPSADRVARVFQLFNTLVLEYSITPLIAHIAFLEIDEYRDNLSPALADPGLPRRAPARVIHLSDFADRAR
jgi:hypothetical protein